MCPKCKGPCKCARVIALHDQAFQTVIEHRASIEKAIELTESSTDPKTMLLRVAAAAAVAYTYQMQAGIN